MPFNYDRLHGLWQALAHRPQEPAAAALGQRKQAGWEGRCLGLPAT